MEGGDASFGVAVLRSGGQPFAGGSLRELLNKARVELSPFSDWISGAQVETVEWGIIPIHPLRRFVYDHLMLVGDSAGQATSWACMGSAMALISGRMAGEAAANALRRGDTSARSLFTYEKQWRDCYGRIFDQAEQLAPLIYAQNDAQWANNLVLLQNLTPHQMIARLRTNWPQLPGWKLAFVVWYDRLGRWRRGLVKTLRKALSRNAQQGNA
jgi:flavin-dependent dehydrogenase